jgi:hypothetical protein
MREGTETEVFNELYPVARFIYENSPNNDVAGYILFFTVFIICAIVYNLGFARKIKLWQNIVVYVSLFIGCNILTIFAFSLPMIEGLIVAAIFLFLYKVRLWREKRQEQQA